MKLLLTAILIVGIILMTRRINNNLEGEEDGGIE